jgi:hypothetical protein
MSRRLKKREFKIAELDLHSHSWPHDTLLFLHLMHSDVSSMEISRGPHEAIVSRRKLRQSSA